MALQNDFESCLESFDRPISIYLLSPQAVPSSKSVVSRSRTDSFRRPYTRSPLGEPSVDNKAFPTRVRSSSRASSFSGSGRDSRYNVRSSISGSFQALPPILSGSSVHFRSNLDFNNFQSFMLSTSSPRSRRPSRLSECPPALPPLPSLSQPLFPPIAEIREDLWQKPSLRHPNSPYVPWDSPVRREIFQPLAPDSSSESLASRTQVSRSAENASPVQVPDHGLKLAKVSQSIRKVHRTVKHVTGVAKKMFRRQRHIEQSVPPHLSINPYMLPDTRLDPPYPPSPGVSSFDSSHTRSLALWLDARRQQELEWENDSRHFMSVEEYERRGSWINLNGEKASVCSNPDCPVHSQDPDAVVSIYASLLELGSTNESRDSEDSETTAVECRAKAAC
ncbi:hypothetical protein D9757_006363 [Collybiopsis confluens]|uniref:Uncharacterized protein n=1 Tax=Collybiopsis confluens TaxID=2823264 RepID=A0A8H5M6W6_9AGAR|nr:hypothetical protein D9757_006363 [Collybiopsis confluens]